MAERRRRDDGPLPISDAIARLAGRLSRRDLLGLAAIQEGWDELVGEQIALHARPLSLVDGRVAPPPSSVAREPRPPAQPKMWRPRPAMPVQAEVFRPGWERPVAAWGVRPRRK